MAEILARKLLPPTIFIASAGVRSGQRDPFVDAVLAEKSLSLGDREPQLLDELDDAYFDLIVTFAPEAHHAALELTRASSVEVEYWPAPDPSAASGSRDQILSGYRDVRDRIEARLLQRFAARQ